MTRRPISSQTARILSAIESHEGYVNPDVLDHLPVGHLMKRIDKMWRNGFLEMQECAIGGWGRKVRCYRLSTKGRQALLAHVDLTLAIADALPQPCSGLDCPLAAQCRSAASQSDDLPRRCAPGMFTHFAPDTPTPSLARPGDVIDWPIPIRIVRKPGEWKGVPPSTAPASVWDLGFRAATEQPA